MLEEYLSELKTPEPLLLNITELPRGVDNYHIDAKLSPKFRADFKKLLNGYLTLETSQKQQRLKNDKDKKLFQDSYVDMMTVLINRVKTDLKPEEVTFLQFAAYRHILDGTKSALDDFIKDARARLTELRSKSSGKALGVQDQVF
ncbi:MAG: hypothetical protein P8M72_02880 [Gammaproteobacteria bacterium]|nr:hypothetical protein [Gammaproteobacteria bacterium]